MPRPPKDYSKPQPYTPGPPPVATSSQEEVVRATWDEFNRIAALLGDPVTVIAVVNALADNPGANDANQPD